jgi:glycerol-3-phosphate acyltransferase PlsY
MGLFLGTLFSTRYVSLSSILTAVAFPFIAVFLYKNEEPMFVAFGIAAALMVVLTHQKNIKRLVAGNENKAKLLKKHRQ